LTVGPPGEHQENQVEPFVRKMGERMTYRVAFDDKRTEPRGAMARTWMEAAGRKGIPAAFLVDKNGRLAWIGHPMAINQELIERLLF
jgi:hypothetical protein